MYKTIEPAPISKIREGDRCPQQFSINYAYTNYTSKPITVIPRSGFSATIPPRRAGSLDDRFIITVTVTVHGGVAIHAPVNDYAPGSAEYVAYRDAVTYGNRRSGEHVLRYEISMADIEESNSLYLDNLDIVLSTLKRHEVPRHPRGGSESSGIHEVCIKDMFNLSIMIVDRHGFHGNRYINIGGQVSTIPTVRSAYVPDGVYVSRSNTVGAMDVVHYRFSDECPVRLYVSAGEARARGDEAEDIKRQYEIDSAKNKLLKTELERELSDIKAGNERERELRNVRERESAEAMDSERKRLEDERNLLNEIQDRERKLRESNIKMMEMDTKAIYDRRTLERKDSNEWLKLVSPTLSVVGLIIGLWVKAKK